MPDMHHAISIDAPPQRVFEALSTAEGLRWWCGDVEVEGAVSSLRFDDCGSILRFRVEDLLAPRRLAWSCLGDLDDWRGTRLSWELEARGKGTELRFTHAGWREVTEHFATTNTCWESLLAALKAQVEA